jgi:hypothetical protein
VPFPRDRSFATVEGCIFGAVKPCVTAFGYGRARCIWLARQAVTLDMRDEMLTIADSWMRLAEECTRRMPARPVPCRTVP